MADTLAQRFWSKVDVRGPDECWPWKASKVSGYGQMSVAGQPGPARAHVVSWELHHGSTHGACVLHRCDNRACVNPGHLFLGSMADNTHDMIAKGRQKWWPGPKARGEHNGQAKLTDAQVREIRASHAVGEKRRAIADRYGIHYSHACALIRGEWRQGT
jgi:hypothetical protein